MLLPQKKKSFFPTFFRCVLPNQGFEPPFFGNPGLLGLTSLAKGPHYTEGAPPSPGSRRMSVGISARSESSWTSGSSLSFWRSSLPPLCFLPSNVPALDQNKAWFSDHLTATPVTRNGCTVVFKELPLCNKIQDGINNGCHCLSKIRGISTTSGHTRCLYIQPHFHLTMMWKINTSNLQH